MTTNLTPVAQYDGNVTIPASGEPRTVSSVSSAFQTLADRAAFAMMGLANALIWPGRFRVASGGSSSGNTGVYLGPISAVVLVDGAGARKVYVQSSELQLTTADHFGGGTLAADTWYYLYAKVSGAGALTFEISTDAPDAALAWKASTGSAGTHRYLGCFRTSGIGAALPMQVAKGRYFYTDGPSPATRVLNAGNATSWAAVSCAALAPPHARIVQLWGGVSQSVSGVGTVDIRTTGGLYGITFRAESTVGGAAYFQCELACNSSQQVDYQGIDSNTSTTLYVTGFSE